MANLFMPFKIRPSKYRHVYGNPHKEDVCYKNIKITKNAHDSSFCAVNPKFVAVVTEECGGGAFIVIPTKHTGRIDINTPKVCGHRGPVLDLKWNPFNDNEIASCSEDTTIKVWQIGDNGLFENLNEWIVDLHGHQRKVGQIEWHPTAENIMISSGADYQVILWNLEKAEPIRIITCHSETIQSMNWSRDGSFFATTCKDKKIRIIDPRSGAVVTEGPGHQGSKISKIIILGCGTKMFTTGFSRLSERQIALWDIKDLSKPIQMEVVDCSSGILIPYYDHDTKIVYVAGKGDGNIRYYEITDSEPYIHYLSEYKSATPQRGLGFMPKRGLDVTKNEIFRFYKLHATGGICEPISMIVPRKSEVFQEDIYPDTISGIPSLSCDEWISGETREPILISMKDGAVPFMPKIVTYRQLGFSELSNNGGFVSSRSYFTGSKSKNGVVVTGCHTIKNSNLVEQSSNNGHHHHLHHHYHNHNQQQQQQQLESSPNSYSKLKTNNNGSPWSTSSSSSSNVPIAEVQPSSRNSSSNNNNATPTRSSFYKQPTQHSLNNTSPPLSPNFNNKHPRLNSETSCSNEPTSTSQQHHHFNSSEDQSTSTDSSLGPAGRTSSNESLNMKETELSSSSNIFKRKTCNAAGGGSSSSSNSMMIRGAAMSMKQHHPQQQSDDLEASYITSVSKNPIMLRKTESLKLDSVQSIRNRFNRISTNNAMNSLTRTSAGKNATTAASAAEHNKDLLKNEGCCLADSTSECESSPLKTASNAATTELTISPSSMRQSMITSSPPLMITSAGSSVSSASTNSTSAATTTTTAGGGYSEYFGLSNVLNCSGSGIIGNANGLCVKKRVWTPVQTSPHSSTTAASSSLATAGAMSTSCCSSSSAAAGSTTTTPHHHQHFAELQKSYYRLLEEKNGLKEQLMQQEKRSRQKDDEIQLLHKRVRQLESKLSSFTLDPSRKLTADTDC